MVKASWLTCWLAVVATSVAAAQPKTLLLVGQGPDNHPRGTHEYVAGLEVLAGLLHATPDLQIRSTKADEPWPEGPELIERTDGIVLFLAEGARWLQAEPRRHQALVRFAARGGGLVALHWAMGSKEAEPIEPFVRLFGGCHGGPDRKYQVIEAELRAVEPDHPITAGLRAFRVRDEFYYQLKFAKGIRPLLEVDIDGQPHTVAWYWERDDGGRSFGFSGLHFHDNWQVGEYRRLLEQAVLWTLKLPEKK